MADVFISYHTKSALKVTERIVSALEAAGVSCWYFSRNVGDFFADSIMEAIENCRIFLLILNKEANESEHVLNEVHSAFSRISSHEKVKFLIIRIGEVSMRRELRYYIGRVNIVNGGSADTLRIGEIVDRAVRLLERESVLAEKESGLQKSPDRFEGMTGDGASAQEAEKHPAKRGRMDAQRISGVVIQFSGENPGEAFIENRTAKLALIETYRIILNYGIKSKGSGLAADFMERYPDLILTYDRNKTGGTFSRENSENRDNPRLELYEGYDGAPLYIGTSSRFAPPGGIERLGPGDFSTKTGQVDRLCEFMRDRGIPVRVRWKSPEGDFPYSWPRPWPGWLK